MLLNLITNHKKLSALIVLVLILGLSYWLQSESAKKQLANADKNFDGSVSQYGLVVYKGPEINSPNNLPSLGLTSTSLNEYQVVDRLNKILQTNFTATLDSVWQSDQNHTLVVNQNPNLFLLNATTDPSQAQGFSPAMARKIVNEAKNFSDQLLGVEMSVLDTNYFAGEYELVNSSQEDANLLTVTLGQTFDGYQVAIGRTSPIRVTYDNLGKLIKAEFTPDLYQISSESKINLLTVESAVKEIKNGGGSIRYAQNELYENVDLSKIISLTIDEAQLYYQPSPGRDSAKPAYLFSGTAEVPSFSLPIAVELIVSAEKK